MWDDLCGNQFAFRFKFKHVNILRQVNKTGWFLSSFQTREDILLCKEFLDISTV